MKFFYVLSLLALIMAVSVEPDVDQKAQDQIEHSEVMCDSVAIALEEMRHYNDSLMIQKYFYEAK
jgi:hypothetical protein